MDIFDKAIEIINIKWFACEEFMTYISSHPIINIYIVLKYPKIKWNWVELTKNPGIKWEDIRNNLDKPWSWQSIPLNPNMSFDIIDLYKDSGWDWYTISKSKITTFKFIIDNPDRPWDLEGVSCNPNITWDIIMDNPDYPWDWNGISYNTSIKWDTIRNNLQYPWNWYYVTRNPNIKWVNVEELVDMNWDWSYISKFHDIDIYIIKKYNNKNWCHESLHNNKYLSNYGYNFKTGYINTYPLSISIYKSIFEKCISDYKELINKNRRELSAFKIQRYFKKSYYDPKHKVCRNIINKDTRNLIFKA
jgi:hypothetical protein